jgi:triphosphatase
MPDEIELKLRVAPNRVAELKRNPLLRSLARRRAVTHHLTSVYFDTPDLMLARNAMALRVRHMGRRRIQTLKLPKGQGNGLQVHRELECEISGDRPEFGCIDDEMLQAFFDGHGVPGTIAPVFVTEFDRSIRQLQLFDSDIEFALDLGEIKGADRALPICEAELELRSGNPRRLFELALALNSSVPLALEQRTKAMRGYGLLTDAPPEPERARPVLLDPEMTAGAAFTAIARNCLAQLRANEACALDGRESEGVHQMRVAVRRMRALIGACKPLLAPGAHATLGRDLRWLQRQLGPARDWDVFVEQTLTPLRTRLPDEPGLAEVARAAQALRETAHGTARAALAADRYTRLLLTLELWLDSGDWARQADGTPDVARPEQPVTLFAQGILARRHKRLHKLGGKHATLDEPDLHRLRLLGKKMRYVAEFFRSLYPRRASRRYLAALAEIQDRLGTLNDAVVTRGLLAQIEERLGRGEGVGKATGLVLGWQAARTEHDLAKVGAVWEDFRDCKPFWKG